MRHAQAASHVGCIGPSGGRVDVPGTMAVLPRRILDDILCRAAVDAGARLLPPARFDAPLEVGGSAGVVARSAVTTTAVSKFVAPPRPMYSIGG